ncbi:MAG: phosphotransferase [Acidimicrobiia bacterium]
MGERFSAARLLAQWRQTRGPMVALAVEPGRSETFLDQHTGVVCKLFDPDAAHSAASEARVLQLAHAHGLPVPRVRSEFEVRGRRGLVLDFVPGAPLSVMDCDLGAENRRAAWRAAGRHLAALHSIPCDDVPNRQWVHGRPDGNAFLVARRPGRSAVSGFVGFDHAGVGDVANDLAFAVLDALLCSYPLEAFVDGYRSVRVIDDDTKARLMHRLAQLVFELHPSVAGRVTQRIDDGVVAQAFAGGLHRRASVPLAG